MAKLEEKRVREDGKTINLFDLWEVVDNSSKASFNWESDLNQSITHSEEYDSGAEISNVCEQLYETRGGYSNHDITMYPKDPGEVLIQWHVDSSDLSYAYEIMSNGDKPKIEDGSRSGQDDANTLEPVGNHSVPVNEPLNCFDYTWQLKDPLTLEARLKAPEETITSVLEK